MAVAAGRSVTVTAQVAVKPLSLVAVMVAVPTLTKVTFP